MASWNLVSHGLPVQPHSCLNLNLRNYRNYHPPMPLNRQQSSSTACQDLAYPQGSAISDLSKGHYVAKDLAHDRFCCDPRPFDMNHKGLLLSYEMDSLVTRLPCHNACSVEETTLAQKELVFVLYRP